MSEPVQQMNQVITDVRIAYPVYSSSASKMNQQVHALHDNYTIDLEYKQQIGSMIKDIQKNIGPELERNINYKKKQMDIQEYYTKEYQQQIFILKLVLFFSLWALLGCLLFHAQWMSIAMLTIYLGFVLSIGFITLFYYLWDYFLRDPTIFDEYNFLTYVQPAKSLKNEDHNDFKDEIIYC